LGLTISDAVNLLLTHIARDNALPFDLLLPGGAAVSAEVSVKLKDKAWALAENKEKFEQVYAFAIEVFGDERTDLGWLSHSHDRFGGLTGFQALCTEEGACKVEMLLGQIDEGMFA
jgi:addiction module RelB/DinJ family antitoxin